MSILFLCSCETPNAGLGPTGSTASGAPDSVAADYNKLTNNGTSFPSTYDVSGHVDNTLSSPTNGTCPIDTTAAATMPQGKVSDGASKDLCDIAGTTKPWQKNCEDLLKKKDFPRNAFIHALKSMKMNADKFRSKKCYEMASPSHYSMKGLNKSKFEGLLSKGIPNKCQMMINNYDERIKSHGSGSSLKCKTASYYIDLCSSSAKVKKSFSYVGYGTCKKGSGFANKSGKGTSLLGTFLTSNKTFNFQKRDASYSAIAKRLGSVPAVPLMGLQKSNSRSSKDLKYLHVGAYTSAGCPSIPEGNHGMIAELAKNGPSMVVNYKEGQMEDIKECSN